MFEVDRSYDVVAMSFPIVYTLDGDHDRDGLLFTLSAYEPLLTWAKGVWKEHEELLPRLHRRLQLIQIVVDGLERYQQMRVQLSRNTVDDHYLLHELGGEEELLHRDQQDFRRPQRDARSRAVRQNYRATVDELMIALDELTRGKVKQLSEDPQVLQCWSASWRTAMISAQQAINNQLVDVNARFNAQSLATKCKLPVDLVRRLMLNDHSFDVRTLGAAAPPYDWFNPLKPMALVRPLVLRARVGERVSVRLKNQIAQRRVGLHLQGEGLLGVEDPDGLNESGISYSDGAHVGDNVDSTVSTGQERSYYWHALHEGVWTINDLGDVRGTQQGTNAHGLFAALIVEAAGVEWHDPETGEDLTDKRYGDGLYVDIIPAEERPFADGETVDDEAECTDGCTSELPCAARHHTFVDFHLDAQVPRSFREFTVFFHDEPEIHSALHLVGEHTVMPLSYRAEPMPNRLPHKMRRYADATRPVPDPDQDGIDFAAVRVEIDAELNEIFWTARTAEGDYLERVAGEEQHHSSWLFGEGCTPVFRAYRGDPARIRLVHAGVKETHVFHLHVHQWRAVPQDTAPPSVWEPDAHRGSQLLDSITIGPQTAVTIDPLYGSGSRQHALGDIIWHCHLYPHFHHGMWGLWRSFDRLIDHERAYPDGTPCAPLKPLSGRRPPLPTREQPGFPWFIDATFPRKSPPPPALNDEDIPGRRTLLRMPKHSATEFNAFADGCKTNPKPGALFVDLDGLAHRWNHKAGLPEQRILRYDVEVTSNRVDYNDDGWHDARGHHYQITGVTMTYLDPDTGQPVPQLDPETGKLVTSIPHQPPKPTIEPFFPRANHGDVVELHFHNKLGTFPADDFDLAVLPVECGLHVHLVKFDVLAADGSSTGWNYLAGASSPDAVGPNRPGEPAPRNVSLHRWVVDEEFGPCFFHDHLLANFRQKHGLFAALIAEPQGSKWFLPDQKTIGWSGPQAVVIPPADSDLPPFREACLAVGDFIPLYESNGEPLNTPHELGGDDDPGAMGVNFRNAPLTFRGKDPSEWFSSSRRSSELEEPELAPEVGPLDPAEPQTPVGQLVRQGRDPETTLIGTYPGERLRIRLIQGSHEEQHSFVTHGLRWRREWHNQQSPLVNQQTIGISEAFTLDLDPTDASAYGSGDYLWHFAAMDDLWLGCWGLIRALQPSNVSFAQLPPLPWAANAAPSPKELVEDIWSTRSAPDRPNPAADGSYDPELVKEYIVTGRRIEHRYAGPEVTDPYGLIYEIADTISDEEVTDKGVRTGIRRTSNIQHTGEPLVLRARSGQWIRVTLVNEVYLPKVEDEDEADDLPMQGDDGQIDLDRFANPLLPDFGVEVSPPRLPIEHTDELGYPDRRRVSPRISLHSSLLSYDVVSEDGANVGRNHDGTLGHLDPPDEVHEIHADTGTVILRNEHSIGHRDQNWREYWWYADPALVPPRSDETGPSEDGRIVTDTTLGQVCYLYDMGDIRNHRHHGLIGALVVEPEDCTPCGLDPTTNQPRRDSNNELVWWGTRARIKRSAAGDQTQTNTEVKTEEIVVFLQDGLRHFVGGDIDLPMRDIVPGDDPEDSGQKAINYRSTLLGRVGLRTESPTPPSYTVPDNSEVWLRLVCAADKPRNHTFTVHGLAWDAAPWVDGGPWTGSVSGLSAATTHDLRLKIGEPGDYAYRSGVFKWAVGQGMWGMIRVEAATGDVRAAATQPNPNPPGGVSATAAQPNPNPPGGVSATAAQPNPNPSGGVSATAAQPGGCPGEGCCLHG